MGNNELVFNNDAYKIAGDKTNEELHHKGFYLPVKSNLPNGAIQKIFSNMKGTKSM